MQDIIFNIIRGLPATIALTAAALMIGLILGVPLMLARISRHNWLRYSAMALITFVRSIPPIVWLFVIFFGLGSGYFRVAPFPAAAAGLGLIASAYMAEIYRGALLSIHRGQWEGAAALGMHPVRMWIDVDLSRFDSASLNRLFVIKEKNYGSFT
ncbi:ABC transporter permease subunit, partial [Ochrobactrum sp. SFR4]|uniref:ABC transporter permease subunit n=1 Tax=Ochrobactrum sp. SFR4 TaxID=2717368 RepID=UPI001C8B4E17